MQTSTYIQLKVEEFECFTQNKFTVPLVWIKDKVINKQKPGFNLNILIQRIRDDLFLGKRLKIIFPQKRKKFKWTNLQNRTYKVKI